MDCNILFSFESKMSALRGTMTELVIDIEKELDNLKKADLAAFDSDFQKALIEAKIQVNVNDLDSLEKEYQQVGLEKKASLSFENAISYLERYSLLMIKSLKTEEKITQTTEIFSQTKSKIKLNEEKIKRHRALKQNL